MTEIDHTGEVVHNFVRHKGYKIQPKEDGYRDQLKEVGLSELGYPSQSQL